MLTPSLRKSAQTAPLTINDRHTMRAMESLILMKLLAEVAIASSA